MPETDLKRADFDSYFTMWNCVMFYPNPANTAEARKILYNHSGDGGVIPCFQHKACGALVRATQKYPPRICPHCKVDTKKEQKEAADGLGQIEIQRP